ncbi:MAG: flagellar hook-length control protein FliK [Betaproteobacteria bacterium]|nr:flagellar hook-length control protein FliK [Betaproteobacteria bacterium]
MTTQLNFSASANPVSALVGAGLVDAKAAPGAGEASGGSQFAELFTGHMLKLERQGIAAAEDAFSSLQVMPLGPGINVITSDAPVPDIQSLVAFAKAQGLDEAAVAGLFGDMPAAPAMPTMPTMPTSARATDGLAAGVVQSPAVQAPTLGLLQAVPGVSILGLEIAPQAASADILPAVSTADVLAGLGLSQAKDSGQRTLETSTVAQPEPQEPGLSPTANATASAALLAAQAGAERAQLSALSAPVPADEAPAAAPMVDALRLHMGVPGEDITRRLAQLAGMQGSVTWADLVAHAAAQQAQTATQGAGDPASQAAADGAGRSASPRSAGSALGAGADAALALASLPAAQAPLTAPVRAPVASAATTAPVSGPVAASALTALAAARGANALAAVNANNAAAAADKLGAPAMATALGAQAALSARTLQEQAGVDAAAVRPAEEEALVLDVPTGLDLADLSDHLGSVAADADGVPQADRAAGTPASAQSAADATRAAIQERAAQTQLLADRMGQAMANKLIGQIERGQWKMQMRLQPGALGRVEVALDMHAGGLDAVFSTDNALTKELLGQGANRLREALTQTGTTVASVTVNADARGHSGGNSTPQKRQPAPQQAAAPMSVGATASRGGRYTAAVAEGLNVLA